MTEKGELTPNSDTSRHDVTRLLLAWGDGDEAALEELYPLVQAELRRLARGRLRHERAQHTLETTGLVHEAFLRLVDQERAQWQSRGHFLAIAARMMRRVLVDYARRRLSLKRGGELVQVPLEDAPILGSSHEVLRVHEALAELSQIDRRKATMIELRFFGGLSIDETAQALGVSPGTVMRDWTLAKAWLKRQLREPGLPKTPDAP